MVKNNVPNPVSLVTRHPDYEIIHRQLGNISDEAMRYVPDNVEDAEKIYFSNKKHICCGCALENVRGPLICDSRARSSPPE